MSRLWTGSARLGLAGCVALAACVDAAESGDAVPVHTTVSAPPTYVDSIIPNEEAQRRFREGLSAPITLSGGEHSREALVRRFADAVETHDTATIRELVLTRAEFAYLYYPHTQYTRPPYELDPALLWFQIQQNSEKGIVRVLRRYGGEPLGYRSHRCEAQPEVQGPNRLWNRCLVTRTVARGDSVAERLFGSIIERDGKFKVVSYANDL